MSSDRERILEMVANGTITQQEANRLLECLGILATQEEAAPSQQAAQEASQTAVQQTAGEAPPVQQPAPPQAKAEVPPVQQPRVPVNMQAANHYSYEDVQEQPRIRGLKISWISGPIEIISYDGNEIDITEYCHYDLKEDEKMEILESDGILQIKWDRRGGIFSLSSLTRMIGKPFFSKHLLVKVPYRLAQDFQVLNCSSVSGKVYIDGFTGGEFDISSTSGSLDVSRVTVTKLKMESVSGAVRLSGVACDKLKASSTSGSVKAEDISTKESDFDTVSGSIYFSGPTNYLKANTVSGGVRAELAACPDKLVLDSISGSLKISLPDNDGFTVKYSSMSGKFRSEFPVVGASGKSGTAVYNSGAAKFKFSTLSGGMHLYKI